MRDRRWIFDREKREITSREVEIFRLISIGQSTREIANELNLSIETIKSHRKNLMRKIGARNMASLVRRGFEIGIIG